MRLAVLALAAGAVLGGCGNSDDERDASAAAARPGRPYDCELEG
jgi:hypothetical protein